MAFGADPHFYPRLFTHIDFADTNFVTLFAAGSRNRFSHMICRSNVTRTWTFRQITGGATVLTVVTSVSVPAIIPGWDIDNKGLEVAVSAAANTTLNLFYGLGPLGAS